MKCLDENSYGNHCDSVTMAEELPIVDVKTEEKKPSLKEEDVNPSEPQKKRKSSKRRSTGQKDQAAKNLKKISDTLPCVINPFIDPMFVTVRRSR